MELKHHIMHLTELWYGASRGGNLSILYGSLTSGLSKGFFSSGSTVSKWGCASVQAAISASDGVSALMRAVSWPSEANLHVWTVLGLPLAQLDNILTHDL